MALLGGDIYYGRKGAGGRHGGDGGELYQTHYQTEEKENLAYASHARRQNLKTKRK